MVRPNSSWLGFAIGADKVRVAQLTRSRAALTVSRLAFAPIRGDVAQGEERSLTRTLECLRQHHRSWPRRAAAAVPSSRVRMTRIELPAMSDVELVAAAGWEAERYLDIDPDEFRIDYCPLGDEGAELRRVLVAAVRKEYADACSAAFHRAGFAVTVLDAAPAALHNVYAANYSDPDAVLVDRDGDELTIHVVHESLPLLTRTTTGVQAGETARAIEAARSEAGLARPCPVFVSGAGLCDPRRIAALSERLPTCVEPLNPLLQIPHVGPLAAIPAAPSEFAVAIGAALRLARD